MKQSITIPAAPRMLLIVKRLTLLCLIALFGYFLLPAATAQMQSVFGQKDGDSSNQLESPQTSSRPDILWMRAGQNGASRSIAYTPDNQYVLSFSNEASIKVFRASDGILVRTLTAGDSGLSCMALSSDGQTVGVSTGNYNSINNSFSYAIRIFRFSDGALLQTIPIGNNLSYIKFSPLGNGSEYIAGYEPNVGNRMWRIFDGSLYVWNPNGTPTTTFSGTTMAFSPNGQYIASDLVYSGGGGSSKLALFNASNGAFIKFFNGGYGGDTFSPDGQYVTSQAQVFRTLCVADTPDCNPLATLSTRAAVFSPDNQFVAGGSLNGRISIYNVGTWSLLRSYEVQANVTDSSYPAVAFSGDSQTIASGHIDLKLWNVGNGSFIRKFDGLSGIVGAVTFSPDGQTVAAGTIGLGSPCSETNAVKLWRTSDAVLLKTYIFSDLCGSGIGSIAFSTDGQFLIVSGTTDINGSAILQKWRLSDDSLIFTVPQGERSRTFAIAPDRQTLVFGGKNLTLVNAADGSLIRTLSIGDSLTTYTPLAFSPNGQNIAIALSCNSCIQGLQILSVSDGTQIQAFANSGSITVGDFSPDGQTFVGGEDTRGTANPPNIKQWQVSNGTLLQNFVGHSFGIRDVKFSLDGQKLVSTGWDKTLRFWQVSNASLLQTYTEETKFDYFYTGNIALSPDGSRLVYSRVDESFVMARNPYPTTPVTNYTISGNITRGGSALSGVAVAVSGSSASTTTTDSSGNYSFTVAEGGSYTVMPSSAGNTFAPASQTFNFIAANQSADFTASFVTYTISGSVQADGANLQGATVSLSGSQSLTTTTDASGNYIFTANAGGNYTVTASKNGIAFSPASQTISNLQANQTLNFASGAPLCTPPPATGVVAWYKAENNFSDSSGGGFNATSVSTINFAAGKVGQAFNLDGNGYATVQVFSPLNLTRYTIAAWIKPSTVASQDQIIVDKETPGSINYYFALISGNRVEIDFNDGAHHFADSTATCPVNQWCHVAGSYDGSNLQIYVNGVLSSSTAYVGTPPTTGHSTMYIGRRNPASSSNPSFMGLIDETQIYNRALSASEIGSIYNAGSAGVCTTNIASTPAGTNVNSSPVNNSNLLFSNVASAGNTVATPLTMSQMPPLPSDYTLPANAPMYDIRTSAGYSGNITVTFNVPNIADSATCARLRSLHFENGAWTTNTNATPSYNAATQFCTVAQTVTSLSPFVVASIPAPTYTINGQITSAGNPLPGVSVALSGSTTPAITDAQGNYSFAGLTELGNYTVTPTLANYAFTPTSRTFNNLSANQTADFTAASTCTYSLTPYGASAPAAGGAGSFGVTAPTGCAWAAAANAGWITITSGASGSGNGTIGYSAAANSGAARSGTVTVAGQTFTVNQAAATYNIAGAVVYGTTPAGQAKNVPNVSLSATGTSSLTVQSAFSSGTYQLSALPSGSYTVTPSKTGDANHIDANDALRIQQYLVSVVNFTPNQIAAADTNGDTFVRAPDAVRIQQYGVGGSAGIAGQWKFLPSSNTYTLGSDLLSENYTAILIGEVTGNWTPPTSLNAASGSTFTDSGEKDNNEEEADIITANQVAVIQPPQDSATALPLQNPETSFAPSTAQAGVTVSLPTNATAGNGATVTIPIDVSQLPALNAANAVQTYAFNLQYESNVLSNPVVDSTGTLSAAMGGSLIAGSPQTGVLSVNYTNANGITGQGTLVNIKFTVNGSAGQQTDLTFVATTRQPDPFIFNEGDPQAMTNTGQFTVLGATAASATVGGRVITRTGRGIRNVIITMTDGRGNIRTATTIAFGYYQFTNVPIGETYIFQASAKHYRFIQQATEVRNISGDTDDVIFVADNF